MSSVTGPFDEGAPPVDGPGEGRSCTCCTWGTGRELGIAASTGRRVDAAATCETALGTPDAPLAIGAGGLPAVGTGGVAVGGRGASLDRARTIHTRPAATAATTRRSQGHTRAARVALDRARGCVASGEDSPDGITTVGGDAPGATTRSRRRLGRSRGSARLRYQTPPG